MTLDEILPIVRENLKTIEIKRNYWERTFIKFRPGNNELDFAIRYENDEDGWEWDDRGGYLTPEDIMSTDWEIIRK